MRTTTIPAQITTVEDRIAGNLTLLQLAILIVPLVLGLVMYALLPPHTAIAPYKMALIILSIFLILPLAIRIRGKIVFDWLVVMAKYHARPRFYIFNKNDMFARADYREFDVVESEAEEKVAVVEEQETIIVNPLAALQLDQLIQTEGLSLGVKTNRKGGLNVAAYQTSQ